MDDGIWTQQTTLPNIDDDTLDPLPPRAPLNLTEQTQLALQGSCQLEHSHNGGLTLGMPDLRPRQLIAQRASLQANFGPVYKQVLLFDTPDDDDASYHTATADR